MAETAHFGANELACHCCGRNAMSRVFLDRLEALRVEFRSPLVLSSAYRCPRHDAKFGGHGRHVTGRAVDILVSGVQAHRLLALAVGFGFTGIGVNQRGDWGGRFLHLDDLVFSDGFPAPLVWSY